MEGSRVLYVCKKFGWAVFWLLAVTAVLCHSFRFATRDLSHGAFRTINEYRTDAGDIIVATHHVCPETWRKKCKQGTDFIHVALGLHR